MAQKKVAGKKTAGNKQKDLKAKKAEETPKMEVEASDDDTEGSEEENDVNFDDGSDSEVKGAAHLVDSEAEEDDDDDDEDDEEEVDDDDEIEPGQISITKSVEGDDQEGDSDEEPDEAPITKKKSADLDHKGGIPKIAVGRIEQGTPSDQILFITRLPTEYKHTDLVALLAKFGPISVINRIKTKTGGQNVVVAFESAEGPTAALAAKPKALTLNGQVVCVSRPHKKEDLNLRTVIVGLIGRNVTKEQVAEHFKSCGEVESVNFSNNLTHPTTFLRFGSIDSVPKALKLHSSELNSRFITVREANYKSKMLKSPACTLTLMQTGDHESYSSNAIEKIFQKHGDITDVDVVCTKAIFAFVTYQTAEQAQKALKALNGKTVGDLHLKLEPYQYSSSARTILVTNLANGVEEDDLKKLFSESGEIESVKMLHEKALIKFTTDDGFCKSFLMNERIVRGQLIFIEPNSTLKHKLLQKKSGGKTRVYKQAGGQGKFKNNNNNNKRPFNKRQAQENGNSSHSFKKSKKF